MDAQRPSLALGIRIGQNWNKSEKEGQKTNGRWLFLLSLFSTVFPRVEHFCSLLMNFAEAEDEDGGREKKRGDEGERGHKKGKPSLCHIWHQERQNITSCQPRYYGSSSSRQRFVPFFRGSFFFFPSSLHASWRLIVKPLLPQCTYVRIPLPLLLLCMPASLSVWAFSASTQRCFSGLYFFVFLSFLLYSTAVKPVCRSVCPSADSQTLYYIFSSSSCCSSSLACLVLRVLSIPPPSPLILYPL